MTLCTFFYGWLLLEFHQYRTMVGRVPEIGNTMFVPIRCAVSIIQYRCVVYLLIKRWRHIDKVNALVASGRPKVLMWIKLMDEVQIRCLTSDIVVYQEHCRVLREFVHIVIYFGNRVKVAHHGPVFILCVRMTKDCLFADILHLDSSEQITFILRNALLAIFFC